MAISEVDILIASGNAVLSGEDQLCASREGQLDWSKLIQIAEEWGMLPLLSLALHGREWAGVPLKFVEDITQRTTRKTLRNLGMVGELAQLMKNLEAVGLTPIAFKGPTLAHLAYGDFALRDSSDLDIYVPRAQLVKAISVLVRAGYNKKSRGVNTWLSGACEVTLNRQNPDLEVDLHWQFCPPYFLPFDAERAAERSVVLNIGGQLVRTLRPEDLLLYLCLHGSRHSWALRFACDVAALTRKISLDWDDLIRETERTGCERALGLGLLLAIELFGATVPEEIRLRIMDHNSSGKMIAEVISGYSAQEWHLGRRSEALFHLALIGKLPGKLRYLWCRTTQPNHLDADFFYVPEQLAAAYYLVRPIRIACEILGRTRP